MTTPSLPKSPDESLAATLLVEVRVLAAKLDTVIDNQGKFDTKLENMGLYCREDMEKVYGRLNSIENWKATHNGAEQVKEKQADVEAINAPQRQQAIGIYLAIPSAVVAALAALATFIITYAKG